jgi:hypothetical protein
MTLLRKEGLFYFQYPVLKIHDFAQILKEIGGSPQLFLVGPPCAISHHHQTPFSVLEDKQASNQQLVQ